MLVCVAVFVDVGVIVGVRVDVPVKVTVGVRDGVWVGVSVMEGVGVRVGVDDGVPVGNWPATPQPPSHTSVGLNTVFAQPAASHRFAQASGLATPSAQNPPLQLGPVHAQHIAGNSIHPPQDHR